MSTGTAPNEAAGTGKLCAIDTGEEGEGAAPGRVVPAGNVVFIDVGTHGGIGVDVQADSSSAVRGRVSRALRLVRGERSSPGKAAFKRVGMVVVLKGQWVGKHAGRGDQRCVSKQSM